MTTQSNGERSPERKKFFSGRHLRGWLGSAIIVIALAFTAKTVYIEIYLANTTGVAVTDPQSLPWIVALAFVGVLVAIKGLTHFAAKIGKSVAVKLRLTKAPKKKLIAEKPDSTWSKDLEQKQDSNKQSKPENKVTKKGKGRRA